MTLTTALRNDTQDNPRWAACTKAMGRTPTQNEFGKWCLLRWDDFLESRGLMGLRGGERTAACRVMARAFEAWLVRS